jgi:hypothetical protein
MGSRNPPTNLYDTNTLAALGRAFNATWVGGAGPRSVSRFRKGFRTQSCHPSEAFDACCGLDHHVDVPKYVPDRVGIERVARHLVEVCILDWYGCGRTRQGPNTVAGAKRGPRRFKSDAVTGTYDENVGQFNSPNSYLFSDQY